MPNCRAARGYLAHKVLADQSRTADDYPALDIVGAYVQGGVSLLLSVWPCAIQDPWRGRGVEGSRGRAHWCYFVHLQQRREEACAGLCRLVQACAGLYNCRRHWTETCSADIHALAAPELSTPLHSTALQNHCLTWTTFAPSYYCTMRPYSEPAPLVRGRPQKEASCREASNNTSSTQRRPLHHGDIAGFCSTSGV
jgi:hypothetical protein